MESKGRQIWSHVPLPIPPGEGPRCLTGGEGGSHGAGQDRSGHGECESLVSYCVPTPVVMSPRLKSEAVHTKALNMHVTWQSHAS